MRADLSSNSTRTLVLVPAAVLVEQALARRRLRPRWAPVMAAGFALYRLAGSYRIERAGGPPGLSQGWPERIVDTGVYGITRNPMYLGHVVWLTGLVLVTRSPLALAIAAARIPWYDQRAAHDEERLAKRFGAEYEAYRERVPRWLGTPSDARRPSTSA